MSTGAHRRRQLHRRSILVFATDQQLVHIITICVSAFGFIPIMHSGRGCNSCIPFLYFLIVIPLSSINVDACPIGPRTNTSEKFASVAGKEEGSSAQTSEGTMNEDERAALDCALYLERSPDVTGESPNDWDQSVGPDGTQDIDSASTINTTVDPTDSAVNKSVSHSNTSTGISPENTVNTISTSITSNITQTTIVGVTTKLNRHSASSAVLPTDMPIVTQAKSWTTADEHSTVMPTRGGIRVDGIINASFELILHSADAEIFRPTEDPPSSPKSPISLPSLLTVTNEAGGSVFYNSACEVDDDALMLRLLAGLVTAILVLHLVNTMKIWYNDWKKSKYRHQSDRESSSSKSIRDPYNEELAEIVQPFQKISRAVDLAIDTNVTNTRTRTRDASLVSNPSLPIHKSAIYTPSNPAHSLTKLQRSYVQRASRGVHPPSYQERVESFETV
ncbi:uncharacterized protein C8R40DRAFT_584232 [Lentinula edodes]|uniref:uncharacterized protein n=1 Tax=Lentinula edodes TaxID=5353 RepID=UPI001E8E5961|nr:uncharacterized protein C8R40DRAFT_584232 [Lentinula edodes]KAH7879209.1 hypothetical protein C8R40DRAFT_584232 [Lentinula edodes]